MNQAAAAAKTADIVIPSGGTDRRPEWILRLALFGEFLGHGLLALQVAPNFVKLLTHGIGLPAEMAPNLLRVIGATDMMVALLALARPIRIVLVYAAIWGLVTGLARPLAGDSVLDFVERWSNWGVPLALLLVRGLPKSRGDWFR